MSAVESTRPAAASATAAERGASAVEYALLVGFIAAVIVGSVIAFGLSVNDLFGFDPAPGP